VRGERVCFHERVASDEHAVRRHLSSDAKLATVKNRVARHFDLEVLADAGLLPERDLCVQSAAEGKSAPQSYTHSGARTEEIELLAGEPVEQRRPLAVAFDGCSKVTSADPLQRVTAGPKGWIE
jgi:hypothetical protein